MLYHPDKHRDPELKRQAEQLFNQVHQAYEGKDTDWLSTLKMWCCIWVFLQDQSIKTDNKKKQYIYINCTGTSAFLLSAK